MLRCKHRVRKLGDNLSELASSEGNWFELVGYTSLSSSSCRSPPFSDPSNSEVFSLLELVIPRPKGSSGIGGCTKHYPFMSQCSVNACIFSYIHIYSSINGGTDPGFWLCVWILATRVHSLMFHSLDYLNFNHMTKEGVGEPI